MARGLSKTRLMSFLQCPKQLWLQAHRPDLAPPIDAETQALFDTGHAVGAIARQTYDRGSGAMIEYDADLAAAVAETERLLHDPSVTPLFEATFQREGLLVRTDVLERSCRTSPRVIEVKASTRVKDEHVTDCAIQAWVIEPTRVRPKSITLAHIDNQFVYHGEGDYTGLLMETDVTADVAGQITEVPNWLRNARRTLAADEPRVPVGTHCTNPYVCSFNHYCWPRTDYPLRDLPGVGRKIDTLVARGCMDVRDVPEDMVSGADQERVRAAMRSGKPILDRHAMKLEFAGLPYPRYHLDFETISFAVPIWAGTRPYQQLPFQWSLHIEKSARGQPEHVGCLDLSGVAPMRHVAARLVEAVGPTGPVFMYTSFERQCLATLTASCPDLAAGLDAISDRLVDLHPIIKRHYCHPDMHGSWSIKAVLPTIAPEMDYAQLGEIRDGGAAQRAYLEAIHPATPATRRVEIRERLLRYCAHDTLAMVRLARWCQGTSR